MSAASPVSMLDVAFTAVVIFELDEFSTGKQTKITAVEIQLISIPSKIHPLQLTHFGGKLGQSTIQLKPRVSSTICYSLTYSHCYQS